jgi:hypothetical protein
MSYTAKTDWTYNTQVTENDINRWEQGIKDAHDLIAGVDEATAQSVRDIRLNMIDLSIELETLKGATLNGVTANIFVESFQTLDDITLLHGAFDAVNEKIYLP